MGWTPSSMSQPNIGKSGQTMSVGNRCWTCANVEWNRINQGHGWVARIEHAIQQVVPTVHDVKEQWNVVMAYELYIGTLLKVPELVFMPGALEKDKPEIWVKRLDQYRMADMKLLSDKRQKVENFDGGGRSPGAHSGRQAGNAKILDSGGGTPKKQIMGPGGNEGAGATPPKDMTGRVVAPMDEDRTTAGMELLILQEEPLGLNRDNVRRVRKRKRPRSGCASCQKWWRQWQKTVQDVPMGVIAQVWDIIMELEKDDRRLHKDDAKSKRQRERERRKKAKAKTKK